MSNAESSSADIVSLDGFSHGVQDVLPFGVAKAEMREGLTPTPAGSERRRRWEKENDVHRAGEGNHRTVEEYSSCHWCTPSAWGSPQRG